MVRECFVSGVTTCFLLLPISPSNPQVVPRDYTGVIRGTKTFLGPVTVLGHLDAGSMNGHVLQEFASEVFTKTGDQTIHAHYSFASTTIGGQQGTDHP